MNNHIEDYLGYYNALGDDPGFAVMLNGPWGSGKTWFIKSFLEKYKQSGGEVLYVSLYGVQSVADIESEFFRLLHPVLSSKGMRVAGKLLSGIAKTSIRFDWDGDGSDDGSVSSQISNLEIGKYFNNPVGFLLVFDDLERASLEKSFLLGYINQFVELQGCKVIIVGNEEEIKNENKDYARIKEKLVGKTFKVSADFDSALSDFIERILCDSVRGLCREYKDLIFEIYKNSGFDNLRHLRQVIGDFERFYNSLPERAHKKKVLIRHLFKHFLILGVEVRHGDLSYEQLVSLKEYIPSIMPGNDNKKDSPLDKLQKKYVDFGAYEMLLDGVLWGDILFNGKMDKTAIEEVLGKSYYFVDENTPDWQQLWRFMDLDDCKFDRLKSLVVKDFEMRSYFEPGVCKHVVGLLMKLSHIGLYSDSIESIYEKAVSYVDHLFNEERLHKRTGCEDPNQEYWGQLGFHAYEMERFKDFSRYLSDRCGEAIKESYPGKAKELVGLINSDVGSFYSCLVPGNREGEVYMDIPILNYVNKSFFLEEFVKAAPENRRVVCYAIKERCRLASAFNIDKEELGWIKEFVTLLIDFAKERPGTLFEYQLIGYADGDLDDAIGFLEKKKGLIKQ